jgi:hypothetical protein
MKIIKPIKATLVTGLLISFYSCQKNNIAPNNPTATATYTKSQSQATIEIHNLNENYYFGNTNNAKINWKKVLGADLKGLATGAGIGAGVGAATGVGAIGGAVVGGLIYGAGSSIEAAGARVVNPDFNPISNPNNPYDYVGYQHYSICKAALTNRELVFTNGVLDYDKYYEFVFKYLKIDLNNNCDNHKSCYCANSLQTTIQSINVTQSLPAWMNSFSDPNISEDVHQILKDYFTGYINSNNYSKFVEYSLSCESIITNSSLPQLDKAIILSTMSTARYGADFWN